MVPSLPHSKSTDLETGTNSLDMCCPATGAKRSPARMGNMVWYLYVLLSSLFKKAFVALLLSPVQIPHFSKLCCFCVRRPTAGKRVHLSKCPYFGLLYTLAFIMQRENTKRPRENMQNSFQLLFRDKEKTSRCKSSLKQEKYRFGMHRRICRMSMFGL